MKKTFALMLLGFVSTVNAHNFDLEFPCKKVLQEEVTRRYQRSERLENIGWGFSISMVGMPIGRALAFPK